MAELGLRDFSMLRAALADTFPGQVAVEGSGFPAWLLLQPAGIGIVLLATGQMRPRPDDPAIPDARTGNTPVQERE